VYEHSLRFGYFGDFFRTLINPFDRLKRSPARNKVKPFFFDPNINAPSSLKK
jgi:hypothetical protein